MLNKNLMVLGIFVVSTLLAGGFWFWMAVIDGDRGPRINDLVVEPETFRFSGGSALIQAEVTDDLGVERVKAVLMDGDSESLTVDLQSLGSGAERPIYSGRLLVPANVRSDGDAIKYTLRLVAVDTVGQESKKDTDIEVTAPSVPPAPPD